MNFLQTYNGKNDWWRYAIIISIFVTPFFSKVINTYILKPVLLHFSGDYTARFIIIQFKTIIFLVLFLLLFFLLHKRNLKSLFTSRKQFDFLRFWLSFSVWGVLLMLVFSVKVILKPEEYSWNFEFYPFLKFFLFCILLLPFRAFFFTLFFNTYLLQMFNRVSKRPWISLIVVVIFCTSLIYINKIKLINIMDNQMVIYYLALSLLMGTIIILDNGAEIILGMFYVSSLISKVFITYSTDKYPLDTIFIKQGGKDIILFSYVIPLVCCPLFFIFLYKVYNWSNWKEKLLNKIDKPTIV